MVHPCGSGAFGYFETTKSMGDLTYVVPYLCQTRDHASNMSLQMGNN